MSHFGEIKTDITTPDTPATHVTTPNFKGILDFFYY